MRSFLRRRCPISALLLAPAALAVHQLRYWLAFGSGASAALGRTGHSYLHSVVPWIVLALALVAGSLVRALGRALGGRVSLPRYTVSFAALWLVCSACLVAIFACQELLEGWFATGHPAGLLGIFGYGGWWAIPASVCVGLVLAAWYHGARWLIEQVARRRRHGPARLVPCLDAPRPTFASWAGAPTPLVVGWSDRGPPSP